MSDEGAFNDGFWGQEAGGVYNPATGYVGNYMEDAISVDTYLDVTHFEEHHVYRLEWQPGKPPPPHAHPPTSTPTPTHTPTPTPPFIHSFSPLPRNYSSLLITLKHRYAGVDGYLSWYIDDKFYMNIGGKSVNDLTGTLLLSTPLTTPLNLHC